MPPQTLGLGSVASRGLVANPLVCTHGRNHQDHGSRTAMVSRATNSNPNPRVKNPKPKPGITKLRKDELADVLPWTGSAQQRVEKMGTPATWVTRLAISLAGSAALYNYNTVAAAMASLYWAWDPVLSTAFANTALRVQYPHAGLWKARVLYAKVARPPRRKQSADLFQEIFDAKPIQRPVLELVIGDGSSATLEMKVGVPGKRLQVQVGEPVEVLVLSDLKNLARFMAVREVYLPKLGIWLAEEPCIERQVFEVLCEDLRENYSWPSLLPPPKNRVKAGNNSLPQSGDNIGKKTSERQQSVTMESISADAQLPRLQEKFRLTDERFENILDKDIGLESLRRLEPVKRLSSNSLRNRLQIVDYYDEVESRREQDNRSVRGKPTVKSRQPESGWNDDYNKREPDDDDDDDDRQQMSTRVGSRRAWDRYGRPTSSTPRQMASSKSDSMWAQDEEPYTPLEPRQMWTFEDDLQRSSWDGDGINQSSRRKLRQPGEVDWSYDSGSVEDIKDVNMGKQSSREPWQMQSYNSRRNEPRASSMQLSTMETQHEEDWDNQLEGDELSGSSELRRSQPFESRWTRQGKIEVSSTGSQVRLEPNDDRNSSSLKKSREGSFLEYDIEQPQTGSIPSRPPIRERSQIQMFEDNPPPPRISRGGQRYRIHDSNSAPEQELDSAEQFSLLEEDSVDTQGSSDKETRGEEEEVVFRPLRQPGEMQSFHKSQDRGASYMPTKIPNDKESGAELKYAGNLSVISQRQKTMGKGITPAQELGIS